MTTDGTEVVSHCFFGSLLSLDPLVLTTVLPCTGYPDEVTNALIYTYGKHPQEHVLPLKRLVPRVVALKVVCALNSV